MGKDRVQWSLYLLCCDGLALYTGVSTDVDRRLRQHVQGSGARSLRRYTQLRLVYRIVIGPRGLALQAEHRIKQLSAAAKRRLLAAQPSRDELLGLLGLEAARSAHSNCTMASISIHSTTERASSAINPDNS